MIKKIFRRRGQVAVFYALLVPIFLFMGGAGLDLGWYYLNVSRLQNAADAAVIVGAKALAADTTNFKNYKYKNLVSKYPSSMPDNTIDKTAGNVAAAKYTLKNISSDTTYTQGADGNTYTMKDSYTRGNPTVTMTPSLYKDAENSYYYVVHLQENIHHFFIGFLDDMHAGVVAVARLDYDHSTLPPPGEDVTYNVKGTDILREMYKLLDTTAIKNWEWQEYYKNATIRVAEVERDENGNIIRDKNGNPVYKKDENGKYILTEIHPQEQYQLLTGGVYTEDGTIVGGKEIYTKNGKTWNEFQDKRNGEKRVHYETGKRYRTEISNVKPKKEAGDDHYDGTKEGTNFDSLNLDFHPDLNYIFSEDWDISTDPLKVTTPPAGKTLKSIQNNRSSNSGYEYRIHSTFNFETPYPVRTNGDADNPEDALYIRIESEPIQMLPFDKYNSNGTVAKLHTVFSTVRQIILNINQSNMDSSKRPLVFYYTGPERLNKDYDYQDMTLTPQVRDSQPVILNLNADARVILFAPHSPVVIRGNNHKMQGFIIAKKFVQLTTAGDYDYDTVDKCYYKKGDTAHTQGKYYYVEEEDTFIDMNGNVQTKPLDSDATRDLNDYEQTVENGETRIEDESYEKAYKLSAFKLNDDSYYNSFRIPSLKRKVYTYLDNYLGTSRKSVDMFFTTTRAGWID